MPGYGHRTIAGLMFMITCHVTIFSIGAYLQLFRLYFSPPLFLRFGHSFSVEKNMRGSSIPQTENGSDDRETKMSSIGSERAVWRPRLIRGLATSHSVYVRGPLWTRRQSVLFLQTAALQTAVPGESVDLVGNNQCMCIIVPLKVFKINPKITVTVRRNHTCLPCHTISVQNLV
jgi:hypothetical protein